MIREIIFILKSNITAILLFVIFAGCVYSCSKPPPKVSCDELEKWWESEQYVGTKWKLAYISSRNYVSGDSFENIVLEPQDCDTCYTLTFDAERTGYITGVSILNTLNIQVLLGSEIPEKGFPNFKVFITELDEPFDGNMYCYLIKSARSIHWAPGYELYFTVGQPHTTHMLFFKRINP